MVEETEGCVNQSKLGGVCKRHGAHVREKNCGHEGCTIKAKVGGVCRRHGVNVKDHNCSFGGGTNVATKGGVCRRHGTGVKLAATAGSAALLRAECGLGTVDL